MNKNVPKLRFKEFSDELNIKPFFECVNFMKVLFKKWSYNKIKKQEKNKWWNI